MKLYTYYRSTAAYRVRIALNYKQIPYASIPVNLLEGKQFDENYSQLNPQMRVPTLIDGDNTLGQSMAILEYLEEKYPERALLPQDIVQRSHARFIANIIACDMHPLNNTGVLKYLKEQLHQEQSGVNTWYHHWLKKGFDALESLLTFSEGLYCIDNRLTLADVCLIPQIFNAFRFEFPMDDYPKLLSIYHHCMTLEAFEKAKPDNQPDAPR